MGFVGKRNNSNMIFFLPDCKLKLKNNCKGHVFGIRQKVELNSKGYGACYGQGIVSAIFAGKQKILLLFWKSCGI
jgi:hypothetical protein